MATPRAHRLPSRQTAAKPGGQPEHSPLGRVRSAAVIRPGGTLVSITAPPKVRPAEGRAVFFVVEPNRDQLAELARWMQQGRLAPKVGAIRPLAETRDAFLRKQGIPGKTIIQVSAPQHSPAEP